MTMSCVMDVSLSSFCIKGFEFFSLKGAYLVSTILLVVFLYSYILYLYRSDRSGKTNYEKYGLLAINDSLDDNPIESIKDEGEQNDLAKRSH